MSNNFKRILLVGDTPNRREAATGFGTVMAELAPRLAQNFDVSIHAVNSKGWQHQYPAQVFPACTWQNQGDLFGFSSLGRHVIEVQPACVVYNNDPWIVNKWLDQVGEALSKAGCPQIGYIAIDSIRQPARFIEPLARLDRIFVYTRFAQEELARHGVESEVLPHGVNATFWTPSDRTEARNEIGLSPASFVLLNPNRNQWRKRNDLTITGFVKWLANRRDRETGNLPDAILHLHCDPWTTEGWHLIEIYEDACKLHGVEDPGHQHICKTHHLPITDEGMRQIYRSANAVISSTSAEGWGLCHSESAACGIQQIVPRHSSFTEVFAGAEDSVIWLTDFEEERSREGFLRFNPRPDDIAAAIETAYQRWQNREDIKHGLALSRAMSDRRLDWDAIATHLAAAIKVTVPKVYLKDPLPNAAA